MPEAGGKVLFIGKEDNVPCPAPWSEPKHGIALAAGRRFWEGWRPGFVNFLYSLSEIGKVER